MNRKTILIAVLCFLGTFFVANSFLDPDFPWHLRHGLDILNGQFSLTDQYSYTMPSFKFVNHSWLTSVIWAVIYTKLHIGFAGVAAFCALIATTAAFVSSGGLLWLMPLVAASYLDGGNVRSNVVTFLFLPLLIYSVQKSEGKKMWLSIIPPLLMLWANMHGGFIIGVIYIWGYFFVDRIITTKKKRLSKQNFNVLLVVALATLATFLTPYQTGTWEEAIRTINNPLLKGYVAEWQPMLRLTTFSLIPLIGLFLASLYYSRKLRWLEIFCILLLVDTFFAVRMAPLFCVSCAFVIQAAYYSFLKHKSDKINKERLNKILILFTLSAVCLFTLEAVVNTRNRVVVGESAYPYKAIEYLEKNVPKGNIFSHIHWNSYMDLMIPSKKVFIDGRMLVWTQNGKPGELSSAFLDYIKITHGDADINSYLDPFCIDTVLWSNEARSDLWIKTIAPVDITGELNKDVWKSVYKDEISVIYQRALPAPCFTRYE